MTKLCPDVNGSEWFVHNHNGLPQPPNDCFDEHSFYMVYVFLTDFILGFCWVYCAIYLSITLNRTRRLNRFWVWEIWMVVLLVGGARLLLLWTNASNAMKYFHLFTYIATIPTAAAALGGRAYRMLHRPFDAFVALGDHIYHRIMICTRWKVYSEGADLNRRLILEEWPDIRREIKESIYATEKKRDSTLHHPDSYVVSRILVSINENGELGKFFTKRKVDPTLIAETPRQSAILPSKDTSYFELVTKLYPGSQQSYYYYADYRSIGMGLNDAQKKTLLWLLNVVNRSQQTFLPIYRCPNVLEATFPRNALAAPSKHVDLTSDASFLCNSRRRRRNVEKAESALLDF
eukprot:TRINITY_DN2177_c0_g1_i1.p1 TRINITY_DN2177_c0_g1~~TRINITY_DN2177_c0_g1_i1.p1  ORF type:complete len:347 (-),score=64.62 TRINITY_DN2177_c0_g1_i1:2109-3149(-)